jgi:hypothetical protein
MLAQREVGDEIRYLGIGNAVITSLIENSLFQSGKRKTSRGLIGKRSVKNVRYEMFTRGYRPVEVTVSSGTELESTGVTVSDDNGCYATQTIYNPRNNTWGRIESVASNVLKGTHHGATTFSCQAGDKLILSAGAQPEGSTSAPVINGTDDQNFNILQFSRWSVSISWVLQAIKQLAGGERLKREKMYLLWEALSESERMYLFGDYTSSSSTKNTTTGQQTGYTGEYPTNRGLRNLAANSGTASNQGNLAWLINNLPTEMGEYTNDNDMYIALCSNAYYGRIVEEMQEKYRVNKDGEMASFGIKSTGIITSGPEIKLMKHTTFNNTHLQDKMLVFAPANVGYVYLEGHDMGPNNDIQTNATHGKQDEIYAYHGMETKDAGKTITWITDLF